MRQLFLAALPLAAVLLAAPQAGAEPRKPQPEVQRQPVALSAERFGVQATFAGQGHGYTRKARRISDCLATYPNYDWRTDRIQVRPGVTRRCNL